MRKKGFQLAARDHKLVRFRYIHTSDAETYWPIAEIVERLDAIEAEAKETDKALLNPLEPSRRANCSNKSSTPPLKSRGDGWKTKMTAISKAPGITVGRSGSAGKVTYYE